jgi:dipeptidase E
MEPDNFLLDRYILQHVRTPDPAFCFLPTASGDSADYIARFYTAFSTLPAAPATCLSFALRVTWQRL